MSDALIREMLDALTVAKKTIRLVNGLGAPDPVELAAWQAFESSPELKQINAAIDKSIAHLQTVAEETLGIERAKT